MSGEDRLDGALDDSIADREVVWEGFKHNHQSLRIVDMLEYKYVLPGLDLTDFVREGILRHTNIDARTGKRPLRYTDLDYSNLRLDQPLFLEGQVVALVDEVAQHSHDLEDGFRAQVVDLREVRAQVPLCARIAGALEQETGPSGNLKHLRNMLIHGIISFFMSDLREESVKRIQQWLEQLPAAGPFRRELLHTDLIAFSPAGRAAFESFSAFVINHVIKCQEVDRMDARAAVVIPQLFRAYLRNPRLLPDYLLDRFPTDKKVRLRGLSNQELDACSVQMKRDIRYLRNICDYIAGMTDSFAVKEFQMMTYPTAGK
jgi:dGTPase